MAQNPDAFFGFRSPSPEPEDAPALTDCPLSNGHFQLAQALLQDTGAYINPSIITSTTNYHGDMGPGHPLVPSQTTKTGLLTSGPADFTSGQAEGDSQLGSQHHPDPSLQTHEHLQAQLDATWDVMDVDPRSDIADDITMHGTSFDPSELVFPSSDELSWRAGVPGLYDRQPSADAGYVDPAHPQGVQATQGRKQLPQRYLALRPQVVQTRASIPSTTPLRPAPATHRTRYYPEIAPYPKLAPARTPARTPATRIRILAQAGVGTRSPGRRNRQQAIASPNSAVSRTAKGKRNKAKFVCFRCWSKKEPCVYQGDGPCNGCLKRGPPMIKTCFIPKEFGDLSLLTETRNFLVERWAVFSDTTTFPEACVKIKDALAGVILTDPGAMPNVLLGHLIYGLSVAAQPLAESHGKYVNMIATFLGALLMPEQLSKATGVEPLDLSIYALILYHGLCDEAVRAVEAHGRWSPFPKPVIIWLLKALSVSSTKFFRTWLRTTTSQIFRAVIRRAWEKLFKDKRLMEAIFQQATAATASHVLEVMIEGSYPLMESFCAAAAKILDGGELEHRGKGVSYWHERLNMGASPNADEKWRLLSTVLDRIPMTIRERSSTDAPNWRNRRRVYERLADCRHLIRHPDLGLCKTYAELKDSTDDDILAFRDRLSREKRSKVATILIQCLEIGFREGKVMLHLKEELRGHLKDHHAFTLVMEMVVDEAERHPAGKPLLENALLYYRDRFMS